MSDFSPLSIFKSQAKQLARDQGLKLAAAQETLAKKSGFADYHELSVVAQRNPKDSRLMEAVFGIKDFSEAIHEDDVYSDLDQELEDQLSGAIADTNASGFTIDALEVEAVDYSDTTGKLTLGVSLTYQGQQDRERVYHGAAFFLTASVELLRRDGRWRLAEEGVSISSSESDADRDRRSEWEHWAQIAEAESDEHVDDRPRISMAQALANELGISVADGELLADAEVTANDSDGGLPYSYWIDFEPVAQGELRADLLARFGSLEYELDRNFFDDIEHDF
ncbi:hypothetical protein [Pseudomonas sp. GM55]|uniref:hypothetical protein n=1 Tax=Pseudomonas sp. GM55 TaxID=1144333 RepID=UPI000270AE66|nr:hypothetical protein [Pseudomonas sp. GM55]EJM78912.1 hypothetical protein PMI31_00237 [Pseudomonas sp. GM55]